MGQKQTFVTPLNAVYAYNSSLPLNGAKEPLGTIRMENNAVYKYVQFSGTTAVALGDAVSYVAFASDGNAVIVDDAHTTLGAGLAMSAVATAGGVQFGWIQIKGVASTSQSPAGSPTLGQGLIISTSTNGQLTLATALTQQVVAWYYGSTGNGVVLCDFPF